MRRQKPWQQRPCKRAASRRTCVCGVLNSTSNNARPPVSISVCLCSWKSSQLHPGVCAHRLAAYGSHSARPVAPPRYSVRPLGAREPARRTCYPTAAAGRAESTRPLLAARAGAASWHEATQSGGGGNTFKGHEALGWLPARSTTRPPSPPSKGHWSSRFIAIAAPATRSLQRSVTSRSCLRSWSR